MDGVVTIEGYGFGGFGAFYLGLELPLPGEWLGLTTLQDEDTGELVRADGCKIQLDNGHRYVWYPRPASVGNDHYVMWFEDGEPMEVEGGVTLVAVEAARDVIQG